MVMEGLVLGVAIGWLRRGRLSNISKIQLYWVGLALAALLLQKGLDLLAARGAGVAPPVGAIVHLASYFLLFTFIYLNRRLPGLSLMALGVLLNFLVIAANGGMMPVADAYLPAEAVYRLTSGLEGTHSLLTEDTRLAWLADVIYLDFLGKRLVSIGDILLAGGLVVFIQRSMAGLTICQRAAGKDRDGSK